MPAISPQNHRASYHRGRMRRFLIPIGFALLALLLGGATLWLRDDPTASAEASPRSAGTALLSARRLPEVLATPLADAALRRALGPVVAGSPPDTCLTVTERGRTIFDHNGHRPLQPASGQKLVTALAALDRLGPRARLRTRLVAAEDPVDGVVGGDAWLVGGGDPVLATEAYVAHFEHQPQVHTALEALADEIVDAGIRRISGRLLGDESRYDRARYVESWPDRYATQNQTGPLSALTVNDNFATYPPEQFVGAPEETPAGDPPTFAARALESLLEARGVVVVGGAGAGSAPDDPAEVAHLDSPPMTELVEELLAESDNQTSELLVKEMGRAESGAGTTEAGVAVVTETMRRLELTGEGTVATDGSGLDDGNRSSCRLLAGILDREGPRSELAEGLAVAGEEGTLSERFVNHPAAGRLRAKTGTLYDVTSLTGFVEAGRGRVLTFAYIANGEVVGPQLLALQEHLGAVLVTYPQGPGPAQLGPQRQS